MAAKAKQKQPANFNPGHRPESWGANLFIRSTFRGLCDDYEAENGVGIWEAPPETSEGEPLTI